MNSRTRGSQMNLGHKAERASTLDLRQGGFCSVRVWAFGVAAAQSYAWGCVQTIFRLDQGSGGAVCSTVLPGPSRFVHPFE